MPDSVTVMADFAGGTAYDEYFIVEGEGLDLTCKAQEAEPAVNTYTWTEESSGFTLNSGILAINSIQRGQGGRYTCTAINTIRPTNIGPETGIGTRTVEVIVECECNVSGVK